MREEKGQTRPFWQAIIETSLPVVLHYIIRQLLTDKGDDFRAESLLSPCAQSICMIVGGYKCERTRNTILHEKSKVDDVIDISLPDACFAMPTYDVLVKRMRNVLRAHKARLLANNGGYKRITKDDAVHAFDDEEEATTENGTIDDSSSNDDDEDDGDDDETETEEEEEEEEENASSAANKTRGDLHDGDEKEGGKKGQEDASKGNAESAVDDASKQHDGKKENDQEEETSSTTSTIGHSNRACAKENGRHDDWKNGATIKSFDCDDDSSKNHNESPLAADSDDDAPIADLTCDADSSDNVTTKTTNQATTQPPDTPETAQEAPPKLPAEDAAVTSADGKLPSHTTDQKSGATSPMDIDAEPADEATNKSNMKELRVEDKVIIRIERRVVGTMVKQVQVGMLEIIQDRVGSNCHQKTIGLR
jgi:hypothetical protein